jgi:hypothetical protein
VLGAALSPTDLAALAELMRRLRDAVSPGVAEASTCPTAS